MIALGSSNTEGDLSETEAEQIDRYKLIDRVFVTLQEAILTENQLGASLEELKMEGVIDDTAAPPQLPESPQQKESPQQPATPRQPRDIAQKAVHSGVFHGGVQLIKLEQPNLGDQQLQAMPGDQVRCIYTDKTNSSNESLTISAKAHFGSGVACPNTAQDSQCDDKDWQPLQRVWTQDQST